MIYKCIDKDAWGPYPVCKIAFYFQRNCLITVKVFRDVSSVTHADDIDGQ